MSDNNREQFNILAKKILELLVDACPVPIKVTAERFELPKGEYHGNEGNGFVNMGFYRSSPEEEVLSNTLKWLEAESYIREKGGYYVATLQSLKLCNAVPNALAE